MVPLSVTEAPIAAMVGVKVVIVGALELVCTVKLPLLVAEPVGAVTVIGPVVAPLGTETTSCVAEAERIVAFVPLKLTVS